MTWSTPSATEGQPGTGPGRPEASAGTGQTSAGMGQADTRYSGSWQPGMGQPGTDSGQPGEQPRPAQQPEDLHPLRPAALPLLRPEKGRVLCGVCRGVAAHLGVAVWKVRLAFVVAAFFWGAGILAYIFLWMFVPVGDPEAAAQAAQMGDEVPVSQQPLSHGNRTGSTPDDFATAGTGTATGTHEPTDSADGATGTRRASSARPTTPAQAPYENLLEAIKRAPEPSLIALAGFILVGVAAVLYFTGSSATAILALLLALTGVGVAWLKFNAERGQLWSMLAGVGLMFAAYALYAGYEYHSWMSPLPPILLGLALLVGFGLVIVPWGNTLVRDLGSARAQKEREEERADIAAHLHDGVLQTLTLIQLHSDEPQTVVTLARQQERELRSWLYRERRPSDLSVSAGLEEITAAVEDEHGKAIEVVSVGDAQPSERTDALLAATRQALLNAVTHGGEPISVYCEATPSSVQIYVRDHGSGFDVEAIDPSRLGIRESIKGRVQRRGGTVDIVSRPNWGTEVRMTMPINSLDEQRDTAVGSDTLSNDAVSRTEGPLA